MSLYGAIQMAGNALRVDQIAMQVVGQNISNANTPGYIREEIVLSPAPSQKSGGLLLGLGVQVEAIVQKIDLFLEERLRGSVSDRASSEAQEELYVQLEELIGELTDTDLSTSLNDFFSSVGEILNQPESISVRNLAVLQGITLASAINRLASRVAQIRVDLNDRVEHIAERINQLTEEIRELNVNIAEAEGGNVSQSDAVGLRDQRLNALQGLAELIDIRVREQESGGVAVYVGGEYLVFEGTRRSVEPVDDADRGLTVTRVHLSETAAPLDVAAGEMYGLLTARDDVLGGFLDRLDDFARTLAFEFNKVYSGGQGLNGFQQLTSEFPVDAADQPLNQAGLEFTPTNGSFQVLVHNTRTGLAQALRKT
jgi:flagellar hook-associated protein 1 FlgK